MLAKISVGGKSLFEELWEYFEQTYFSPEIPHLDNFDLGTGTLVSLKTILIGLTLGLIFASFITIYNKRYIGSFVRKMLKEGCIDKENAKTLEELGYLKNPIIRQTIKTDKPLSRWIKCVEEDEFNEEMAKKREAFEEEHRAEPESKEKKKGKGKGKRIAKAKVPKFTEVTFRRDVNTMHFYIPEEKKYAIDIKYDAKGANWVSFILVAVVSIVACAFLCFALPDLIKMIDNVITVVGTQS